MKMSKALVSSMQASSTQLKCLFDKSGNEILSASQDGTLHIWNFPSGDFCLTKE